MKPFKIGHHFVIHCAPAIDIVLKPRLGALRGILTKLWSWFRQVSIGQRWSTWTDFNPKIWQLRTIWHRLNYSCFNFLVLRNFREFAKESSCKVRQKGRERSGRWVFRIYDFGGLMSERCISWTALVQIPNMIMPPWLSLSKISVFYASPIN